MSKNKIELTSETNDDNILEIISNNDNKQYDAIVTGTRISGGWAAKELCESSLKALVLERGRMVNYVVDYSTATMDPLGLKYGELTNNAGSKSQEKQSLI